MTRDIPFDEEVAERDQEDKECFADVRPLQALEEARARWAALFDSITPDTDAVTFARAYTNAGFVVSPTRRTA
jgi:hypothetical protein